MFYRNQRQIIINRDMVQKSSGKLYLVSYQDNLVEAMKRLSPTAFKVYICLLFNKDQYSLDFSPQHIGNQANIHKDTARKAFIELEDNGFIVKVDEKHFLFYEVPKIIYNLNPVEEKREFIDNDTGEIHYLTYKDLQKFLGIDDAISIWREARVYEPKTD